MKKYHLLAVALILSFLVPLFSFTQETKVPDSLGLPGDNLNLYAVMKVFQESKTLEEFERKLNDKENHINNLDLNNDNKVDYIRVVDHKDGDNHNIVLQVPVTGKENQDVAVFNVEKNKKGEVTFQLVGDEDLYGKDYIIQPNYFEYAEGETPNPAYKRISSEKKVDEKGNVTIINNYTKTEIAEWPMMLYLFGPGYSFWVSPWYWDYYPSYWYPWTPWYWHQYYGWHINYYYVYQRYYHYGHHTICPHTHYAYYHNERMVSPVYYNYREKRAFNRTYERPETRAAGRDMFNKEVESKKIIMPGREERRLPMENEMRVPEKGRVITEQPIQKEAKPSERKPITPQIEKQRAPEMREIPQPKLPEKPRAIRERPIREEMPPKRDFKRKTSSANRKKQEMEG